MKKDLELPKAIQEARLACGHKQLSLSTACSVTLSWLCHVENGTIRPGFERLGRIAREIGGDLNAWAEMASRDEAKRRAIKQGLQDTATRDSLDSHDERERHPEVPEGTRV